MLLGARLPGLTIHWICRVCPAAAVLPPVRNRKAVLACSSQKPFSDVSRRRLPGQAVPRGRGAQPPSPPPWGAGTGRATRVSHPPAIAGHACGEETRPRRGGRSMEKLIIPVRKARWGEEQQGARLRAGPRAEVKGGSELPRHQTWLLTVLSTAWPMATQPCRIRADTDKAAGPQRWGMRL